MWLLLVGVFLAFNLLLFNHDISLWDDDEAAYAGFGQQMLASGDWVNPHSLWADIHRKPPLHFWTVAISFSVLGDNEFALRLPSVLAVWLTCASLWWFGRRLFGEDRAAWAATILASSFVIPIFGKVALTDATLLLFQTTAVLGLLNYVHEPRFRWNLLLWTSVALGLLAKGPPIVILIGGLWVWLLVFHPQRRNLIGTHPWLFLPLALLPLGTWMYLSWLRDDGRLLTFLYQFYVVQRIGGSVLGQTGPPGYHLVVLLISFAAWMPFLWMAIGERLRTWRQPMVAESDRPGGLDGLRLVVLRADVEQIAFVCSGGPTGLGSGDRSPALSPRSAVSASVQGCHCPASGGLAGSSRRPGGFRLLADRGAIALAGGNVHCCGDDDRPLHGQASLAIPPSWRYFQCRFCHVCCHRDDRGGRLGGGTFSHQGHKTDGGNRLPLGEGVQDHSGVHRPDCQTEEKELAGVSLSPFSIAPRSDTRFRGRALSEPRPRVVHHRYGP